MSEYLAAAAANLPGVPEELVLRSATARAQAQGVDVDDILKAWAGGEALPTAPTTPKPPPSEPETTPEPEPAPTDTTPTPEPTIQALVAATAVPTATVVFEAPRPPERVAVDEASDWEVVTSIATAGLQERMRSVIPRWLVAVFVAVPLFSLGYLVVNGPGVACGDAGQLAVDRFGEPVNCDGSAFEGRSPGPGGDTNFFALGAGLYSGEVAGGNCFACHGDVGQGASAPALGAVVETFGSCSDHITWITLGSLGWAAQIGLEYGDNNTAVQSGGVMPPFGQVLTPEQVAAVTLYERVQFGGADLGTALTACGLAAPENAPTGEDEPADNGEAPPEA